MKDTERMVKTIIDNSRENSIPVVQCFTRRKLARLFGRGQSMSCVCILKDSFTVVDELKQLQDILLKYHLLFICYNKGEIVVFKDASKTTVECRIVETWKHGSAFLD